MRHVGEKSWQVGINASLSIGSAVASSSSLAAVISIHAKPNRGNSFNHFAGFAVAS